MRLPDPCDRLLRKAHGLLKTHLWREWLNGKSGGIQRHVMAGLEPVRFLNPPRIPIRKRRRAVEMPILRRGRFDERLRKERLYVRRRPMAHFRRTGMISADNWTLSPRP